MFKDLKWLLFGGIRWRLRGFLIGFAVGVAATMFFGQQIQGAFADEYCDQSYFNGGCGVAATWTSQNIPVDISGTDYFASYQLMEAQSTGYLTSVSAYIARSGSNCDDEQFAVSVFEYVDDTTLGAELGASEWMRCDEIDSIHTSASVENFVINSLGEQNLRFTDGEEFWVGLHFLDGTEGSITIKKHLTNAYGANQTSLWCVDYDCSGTKIGSTVDSAWQLETYFDQIPVFQTPKWQIESGPYYKGDWSSYPVGSYALDYYCYAEGDIYGKSVALGDTGYNSLGQSCDGEGDSGTLTLSLHTGSFTDWSLSLYQLGYPTTTFDIEINHDDIWTTYEGLGGDSEDDNIIISAFNIIWTGFKNIPVVGDALTINELVFTNFLLHLGESEEPTFHLEGDFFGSPIDQTVDLGDIADTLETSISGVSGYDELQTLVTGAFLFLIIWGFWTSNRHKDDI